MASQGNNISGEIEQATEEFFSVGNRREFFNELMKNKRERKIHDKLCSIPAEKLYAQAKKIMKDVELGKFNAKEMEEAEHRLVHLFGAIEGMQQVIILEQDHGPVPL